MFVLPVLPSPKVSFFFLEAVHQNQKINSYFMNGNMDLVIGKLEPVHLLFVINIKDIYYTFVL